VRHEIDGLLFPPGDSAVLAACLDRLARESGLVERLRAGIRRPLSIREDAAALRRTYEELIAVKATPAARRTRPSGGRSTARVTAIVLNYKTADQTWLAVRSLQTSLRPPDRIVIVDNGSDDGSAAKLRAAFPRADVVESPTNIGFPSGCNIG